MSFNHVVFKVVCSELVFSLQSNSTNIQTILKKWFSSRCEIKPRWLKTLHLNIFIFKHSKGHLLHFNGRFSTTPFHPLNHSKNFPWLLLKSLLMVTAPTCGLVFLERKPAKLAPIAEMDVKHILVCFRLPEGFSWSKVLEILKNKLSKKKYGLPTYSFYYKVLVKFTNFVFY